MQRNKQNCTIDIIFVILYAAYYLMPAVHNNINFMIPFIASIAYIVYTIFSENKKMSYDLFSYILLITFVAFLYTFLTDTSTISATGLSLMLKRFFSKAYQMAFMFLPILFFRRITQNASEKQILFILIVAYIIVGYVVFATLRELSVNANVTRSWEDFSETADKNIADYYFVYAVPFIVIMLTYFSCILKRLLSRIICIVGIVGLFYFLFVAQYTLAILITFICMVIVLLVTMRGLKKYLFASILLALLLLSRYLLQLLIELIPSDQVSLRLQEIYNFLFSRDSSGYNLNGRLQLYWNTIVSFLQSPIYGNRSLNFDGHATFLTVLASLGLLGGIPFYYLYFHANKILKSFMIRKEAFMPVFTALLMMGFTNPIHTALPLMYTVWFLVPLTIEWYARKNKVVIKDDFYNQVGVK